MTSITVVTGASIDGRALAWNGAVTLDTNTITPSVCQTRDGDVPKQTATPAPTATPLATPTPAAIAPVATSTPAPTAAPTRPVAVLPAQTLPSTSTSDGSAPLMLGGLLLIITGALLVRSRRSQPTD